MGKITRRGLVAAVAAAGLAACSADMPKGPDERISETASGYRVVDNGDGATLSYGLDSGLGLIERDGYLFKDFEGTGELVPYADWRLPAEERARDLAERLTPAEICGLMCFSSHQASLADTEDGVTDELQGLLEAGVRSVLSLLWNYPAHQQARWANALQARAEGLARHLPVNIASDPRTGANRTDWPSSLALAASFDPALARRVHDALATEMRLLGVTTFLGPKADLPTDPRWQRFFNSFGEDPALDRDLCRAAVDGLQSTFGEDGEDLGWGARSVVAMAKRWPAEGCGEGGREGHMDGGKYSVYPGGAFATHLIPFVDGALAADGKAGAALEAMTSYTIAWSEDGSYGELVGSGFSGFKVRELLWERAGFTGAVCTDWYVLNDEGDPLTWKCWGVEDPQRWDPVLRAEKAMAAGVDQMGGWDDPSALLEAFERRCASIGREEAERQLRVTAERLLLGRFLTGLFEDPYVDVDLAREKIDKGDEPLRAEALAAQERCVVMLKNHGDAIRAAEGRRLRAYVPLRHVAASRIAGSMDAFAWEDVPGSCELPLSRAALERCFDVITDDAPAEGDGVPQRRTAEEIAGCDLVLVVAQAPSNASALAGRDEAGEYVPLSLQYRPYVADGPDVRRASLAGDLLEDDSRENRSYFGRTSQVTNEGQLDQILEAAALARDAGIPCVVVLETMQPVCVHEFEGAVDAILVSLSGSAEAACRVAAGLAEPTGLLPFQMPASMEAVERQLEDVPRDMECHVDADGNTYDFGFGLGWAGTIDDERTARYRVPALTEPEWLCV